MRLSLLETGFWYAGVLRAAGMPYGAVPAAVRMVQWADVHQSEPLGLGHAFLGRRRGALACDAAAPRLTGQGDTVVTIDAAGQSSLLVGPGALDLATVRARRGGIGAAVIANVTDLAWLGGLADHAAGRGLACMLSFACAPDAAEAADLAQLYSPARTLIAVPSDSGIRWFDLGGATTNHDRLMAGAEPAVSDLDDHGFALSPTPAPGAALVCWGPDDALSARIAALAVAAGAWVIDPAAVAALGRKVVELGVAVDDDEWRHLAITALTTVIPSSADSLAAAGADQS
jgi:hypothetical protein